ncbi:hypothetical protein Moror_10299 [Moniliophthora roreri MCA 2997]|uniref:DUF6533 domain-containing protein n=2 Tax=Moniliophthora roreri TaxID=221103 RepID=V2XHM2_MONRO|nr:hypothetical protein Moror_10299 [Moniliophthora roreri MCA 2997]
MEWDWNSPDVERHFRDVQIHGLMEVFGVSILFWDHVITFDLELQHIWTHFKSRSSLLFIAFRYFTLLSSISKIALTDFDSWTIDLQPIQSLPTSYPFHFAIGSLLYVSSRLPRASHLNGRPKVLLTLRLYALYASDKRVLILFAATASLGCGLAGYALSGQEQIQFPIEYGCYTGNSRNTSVRIVGIWMVLFAYDTIVFLMTAYRTYRYWRMDRTERENLLSLMFRDGASYFGVMALANMANILTFLLCGPFMSGGLSTFASCISAAMLCRLMLNLHETAHADDTIGRIRTEFMQTWRVRTMARTMDADIELHDL